MLAGESAAESESWMRAFNENIREKATDTPSQVTAVAARAEYDERLRKKAEAEKASLDKKEQKVLDQQNKEKAKEDARCRQAIDDTVKLRSSLVALDSTSASLETRFVELTKQCEKSTAAIELLARTIEPLSPTGDLLNKLDARRFEMTNEQRKLADTAKLLADTEKDYSKAKQV